jgi:hypothetical protein
MTQYNQSLMSNYVMNPVNQLQCAPNFALAQQSANEAFLQNVAFNKLFLDLYARLLANNYNCSPVAVSPTEIKQENNLNWLMNEAYGMNVDYKTFNIGQISNS